MRMTYVKVGDIVLVNRKGRNFHAIVTDKEDHRSGGAVIDIQPIEPNITYRQASARSVIGHWRKAKVMFGRREAHQAYQEDYSRDRS